MLRWILFTAFLLVSLNFVTSTEGQEVPTTEEPKRVDGWTCDWPELLRCGYEECHQPDKCVDMKDELPECIDNCHLKHCEGYKKNQLYVECGGIDPYGRLYTACGRGCYSNDVVNSPDFNITNHENQKFLVNCFTRCRISACDTEKIPCKDE